jgi:hypothetical protein
MLRRAPGVEEGNTLVEWQEQGRPGLEKPESFRQRLKSHFANVPAERHPVDELVAKWREEGRREEAE